MDITIDDTNSDSIVRSVIQSFLQRSKIGKEKYKTTLDREDLSLLDWIQHCQEEHMDSILYLEKIKKVLNESENDTTSHLLSCKMNSILSYNLENHDTRYQTTMESDLSYSNIVYKVFYYFRDFIELIN
jgi:hypothetical protein